MRSAFGAVCLAAVAVAGPWSRATLSAAGVAAVAPAPAPAAVSQTTTYRPPVLAAITRHFEPPPTPYSAGHRGIDFGVPIGTDVDASEAGVVAFAGRVGSSLFVSIDHADGLRTTYSFLSVVLTKAGAQVAQGDLIARSGPGAAGEQPNLHFGIRRGSDYLDPEPFLVAGFRRDFSQLIRLTGGGDRVGIPPSSQSRSGGTAASAILPAASGRFLRRRTKFRRSGDGVIRARRLRGPPPGRRRLAEAATQRPRRLRAQPTFGSRPRNDPRSARSDSERSSSGSVAAARGPTGRFRAACPGR